MLFLPQPGMGFLQTARISGMELGGKDCFCVTRGPTVDSERVVII